MNMKPSSKPISSPGRTDKFPPPLMRFLRTNVSSRSRGRSRSSPMFVRKKTATAIDSQEPSSPKVTCMGQVRVRRSSKHHHAAANKRNRHTNGDASPARSSRQRWWIRQDLFCGRFTAKIRPSSCHCHCHCLPFWSNCGFFHLFSLRRKRTKVRQDSSASQLNIREGYEVETWHEGYEFEEERFQERANANEDAPVPTMPPKNALLLTRCRSAPYRSSSLASKFWGSPFNTEEREEGLKTELQLNVEQTEHGENHNSQTESISDKEERLDPRTEEEKPGFFKELEDSIRERIIIKSENAGDLKGEDEGGDSARPLILTRCKSEPARTGQKLDPELNFWKKRRLGWADSCSPHYHHRLDIWRLELYERISIAL